MLEKHDLSTTMDGCQAAPPTGTTTTYLSDDSVAQFSQVLRLWRLQLASQGQLETGPAGNLVRFSYPQTVSNLKMIPTFRRAADEK